MKYVWIKYEGESEWEPFNTYPDKHINDGSSIMSDCQADMQDERDHGNKVKLGGPYS